MQPLSVNNILFNSGCYCIELFWQLIPIRYFLKYKVENNRQNQTSKGELEMPDETLDAKVNYNSRTKKQEQSVTVKAGAKRKMLMQPSNNKAKNSTNFRYQAKLKKQSEKAKA